MPVGVCPRPSGRHEKIHKRFPSCFSTLQQMRENLLERTLDACRHPCLYVPTYLLTYPPTYISRLVGRLQWSSQPKTILHAHIHQNPTIAPKNGASCMIPTEMELMEIWKDTPYAGAIKRFLFNPS